MARDIETQRFLLEYQRLLGRPFGRRRISFPGFLTALGRRTEHGKNIDLVTRLVALVRLTAFHGVVQRAAYARPRYLRPIEGAALDQTLDHAPVHRGHVDPPAKVEQRFEGTVFGP